MNTIKAYADKVAVMTEAVSGEHGFAPELCGYAARGAVRELNSNWQAYMGDLQGGGATELTEEIRNTLRGDIDDTIAQLQRFKEQL